MRVVRIKKGRNVPLKGRAAAKVEEPFFVTTAAVKPADFYGFRPRIVAKEGMSVKVGSPVFESKDDARLTIVSPVSGRVKEIRRGEKRRILAAVIEAVDDKQAQSFEQFSPVQISALSRRQVVGHLLQTGSWAFLRQRPFDHIADPDIEPNSIFIKAIDTNPLAIDYDAVVNGQDELFALGVEIVQKLTQGPVYLCIAKNALSRAFRQTSAQVVAFDGPHPAGNVGTHIHVLDPIDKNRAVWYVDAQDILAIAKSFLTGQFCPEKIIAIAGEKAARPLHQKTVRGASVASLIRQEDQDTRVISGSVLSGKDVGPDGYLGFYDTQLCFIARGGRREFLGWTMPGFSKFSFSRTYFPPIGKRWPKEINTDAHGSHRAIVFNDVFDQYVALDVMTFFLIKAILAGEIEEMERLGILECAPEDFALAAFACPSKTDVCGIIQQGLELIESEG